MKDLRKGWVTRIKLNHCMTSGKEIGHSTDDYEKYPDPDMHIIKITETEKGEQGEEGSVSSNSDGS